MRQEAPMHAGPDQEEAGFPEGRVPWTVLHGFGVLACFILLQAFFSVLSAVIFPGAAQSGASTRHLGRWSLQLGGSAGAVLLLVCLFLRVRSGSARRAAALVGFRIRPAGRTVARAFWPVAIGVPALVLCSGLQAWLMRVFRADLPEQEVITLIRQLVLRGESVQLGLLAFFPVVAAPVAEELVFRAVVYRPLRARLRPVVAAVVVSAAFSIMHPPVARAQTFVLALILTWLMEATRSIVAPMLLHSLYNAAAIALIVMGANGGGASG